MKKFLLALLSAATVTACTSTTAPTAVSGNLDRPQNVALSSGASDEVGQLIAKKMQASAVPTAEASAAPTQR